MNKIVAKGLKFQLNGQHHFSFDDILWLRSQLAFIPDETKLKIEISEYNEKKEKEKLRTEQQNKYYHLLLDIICDYTGDVHLELHDKLKAKFLGRPYIMDDKEYIIVPSTTELNSKNFADFIEKVFAFSSQEYNLILPSSTDYY